MIEGTLSKGEFAERINVTPGRVSQLIKEGKIRPSSLEGEGRRARVIVKAAMADLERNLDPAQRFGSNGMSTRIGASPAQPDALPANEGEVAVLQRPASQPSNPNPNPNPGPPSLLDNTAEQIGREKLRQAQMATRRMEREEALEEGRYVLADEARAAIASASSKVLATFESGLSDMADAIAAAHGLPPRDALHTLTKAFREIRESASRSFDDERQAILDAETEALRRVENEDNEDRDSEDGDKA